MKANQSNINVSMKLFTACSILLVVAAHIYQMQGFSGPFDLFRPYSFHVAAFVFVSGYFYNTKHELDPFGFIRRKFVSLIVPLFAISVVYGMLCSVLQSNGFSFGDAISWQSFLIAPLTSGHQFEINSPMWFVAPLFFSHVVNIGIRRVLVFVHDGAPKEAFLLFLYLALGSMTVIICADTGIEPAWQRIDLLVFRTFFFLSCMGMGRFYRAVLERHDTLNGVAYFSIALLIQLIVIAISHNDYVYLIAWCRFPIAAALNAPLAVLITYLATINGIAVLLRFCKILGPYVGNAKAVRLISDNSFSIMSHHLLGFFLLNSFYFFTNRVFGLFSGFDAYAFKSSIYYFYMPFGLDQFAVIYFIVGVFVSLFVHITWVRTKDVVSALKPS